VLWAPTTGFGENTAEKWRSTLLEHAQTPADISVDSNHLRDINSKVKIIHGTEDKVVDMENSRKFASSPK